MIDETQFGSIIVAGTTYDHDIFISLDRKVRKRKKKLSKMFFGTSHILSLAEAEYVYEEGTTNVIIGTGQSGMLRLSSEAALFFQEQKCTVTLLPTPEAIRCWNEAGKSAIGLFHVTC